MTGASKILTVSYGTFSCTLEGFEDPFSTMKVIAEYFRDLAADDRFFGAEPPTPDADMLHRIAEGASQRRVQAQMQENGVVLRQGDAITAQQSAPPAAPAPALLDKNAAKLEADEAAARLIRLRAEIDEKSKYIEALEARTAADVSATPITTPAAASGASAAAAPTPAPTPALAAIPSATTAASAAIETLLGQSKDSYTEDSDSADSAPPKDLGALAGEPVTSTPRHPTDETITQRRVIRPDPNAPAQTIRGGHAAETLILEAQPALLPLEQSAPAPTQAFAADPNPGAPKYRVEVVRGGQDGKVEIAEPPAQLARHNLQTPRPRVIRIRRVAQTGGITNAWLAETQAQRARLSHSQEGAREAALAAELAALEAPAPLLLHPAAPRAKINPTEATLDKLIARANNDLADDDLRRRQAALAHMKAAAAATKADRDLGADATSEDAVLDTYRHTLDQVAPDGGPRSATLVLVSEQRIGRNEAKRSDAPLRLAPAIIPAENIFRANDDEDDASGPQSNIFSGMETFEDFADRLGASEQIELMEASAIYVAHIEKQPLFRRRQLIRHMSSLPDALPMTREASVQIFNQLLGMGRFAEMEPGLFAVTDRSPLLAEALREAI
jgi:hypothetical protein